MLPWVIGMAAVSAYSAYSGAKQANKQADIANENARRRYLLESGVAQNQMEEQNSIAMQQMTEVGRAYMKSKGEMKALQSEGMVGGNVTKKLESVNATKFDEAKGKVAKDVNTNIINIAQGMIANKVDTEAMIAEANAKRQNVLMNTLIGGISGGASGYALGRSISGSVNTNWQNAGSGSTAGQYNTSTGEIRI